LNRHEFLKDLALAAALPSMGSNTLSATDADPTQDWLARWQKNILGDARSRYCDKEMSEAMGLHPVILMAEEILKTPALKDKFGPQAQGYLKLAEQVFEKLDSRGCWREVANGGLWTALVPYDRTLRRIFMANHDPSGWGGLSATPRFLAREAARQKEVKR
jgi:hypothetical protein